jgi:thiol-disulfide isomerase/thioredoxin
LPKNAQRRCGPCRKEIPTIQAIVNKFADSHLDIAIVNTAESEDTVFNFLGLLAPDINTLMDEDGLVTEKWQPRGLPATFFVDPKGKIRYLALGGRPWDQAEYFQFLKQLENKP